MIRSSWRQRHAVMTPLFVDSQSQLLDDSGDVSMMESQIVRATQDDAQFTPTQQPGLQRGLLLSIVYNRNI